MGASEQWEEVKLQYRVEEARTEPFVSMVATDNYLLFTLRYVVDYRLRRTTADALYASIEAAVERSAAVQLASETIEVLQTPLSSSGDQS